MSGAQKTAGAAPYIAMAASAICFALMNFFARLASADAHWASVAAVRALVGALVAIGFAKVRGVSVVPAMTTAMWLRSIFGTLAMGCSFYAVSSTKIPLADVVTLNNMTPVFLAVLSPIALRERGGHRVGLAIVLSLLGVLLVVRPPLVFGEAFRVAHFRASGELAAYGDALVPACIALFGAFCSALAMMSLRRARGSPEAIAAHFSLLAATVYGIVAVAHGAFPPARAAGSIIAAGVFAGFAQIAMTYAYRHEHAARLGVMSYLTIAVAAVLGAAVLQESLSAGAILGVALVILGGSVIAVAGVRDRMKPSQSKA